MRKNKAKATAKVDAFLAETFANDEARMERIIEQAKAESFRRAAEQPENAKKKGLWRGAPALCALVIILLVAPIIAVIVNPVSFSKANQLVRKATVWVNDTFKLGIELPNEDNETVKQVTTTTVYETIEEAASCVGKRFLTLKESEKNKLLSIEVTTHSGIVFITQIFEYRGNRVWLSLETIFDHSFEVLADTAVEIKSDIGTLWLWPTDNMHRAIGIVDDWSVDLKTLVEVENIEELISLLAWVN